MAVCAKGAQRGSLARVRARFCLTGPLVTSDLPERGPVLAKLGFLLGKVGIYLAYWVVPLKTGLAKLA
jgi:hypothetical protein